MVDTKVLGLQSIVTDNVITVDEIWAEIEDDDHKSEVNVRQHIF